VVIFQSFFSDFSMIAQPATSHVTISLNGCVSHT